MVHIIDECMGRGKSSAMINYVNDLRNDGPFLFVVPYKSEIERILAACSSRGFVTPEREDLKLYDLKGYMKDGMNAVCTHKLFTMFDAEVIQLALDHGYSMVMDETPTVIDACQLSKHDAADIETNYITVDEEDVVHWIVPEYTGAFDGYKEMAEHSKVFRYGPTCWVNVANPTLFKAFKEIFVLTYMFNSSMLKCYFDLYGIPYDRKYVAGTVLEEYHLSDEPGEPFCYDYGTLIKIVDKDKMNEIGDDRTALSRSWYTRSTAKDLSRLKRHTYNFFHNAAANNDSESKYSAAERNLWTTFCKDDNAKDYPEILGGNGYKTCFLACNARGTNEYRTRTNLAYLVNRFPDTSISNYFSKRGLKVSQNEFGLSEMLQWIWRSAIRDGKPIQIYIPSSRMRNLLIQWIDDTSKGVRY